jgi:hypothetical protein
MTVVAVHTVALLRLGIAVIVLGVTGIILGLRITRLERELATGLERVRRASLTPEESMAELNAMIERTKLLMEDR